MRNLVTLMLVAAISVAAQAAPTLFTRDSLNRMARKNTVSRDATRLYDSKVVVYGAVAWKGDGFGEAEHIPAIDSGDLQGGGKAVVESTGEGAQNMPIASSVSSKARSANLAPKSNPAGRRAQRSNAVTPRPSWLDVPPGLAIATPPVFSNAGGAVNNVDNGNPGDNGAGWCVIPAPGAVLLGSIGIGIVGWLRRSASLA